MTSHHELLTKAIEALHARTFMLPTRSILHLQSMAKQLMPMDKEGLKKY